LFANQSKLLKLPVPNLAETCERYIETIKPLVPEDQFKNTIKIVEDFKNGPGRILQERLLQRYNKYPNWLSDYWNSYAYMAYRDPVVINVNYFFAFADDPKRKDPAKRAGF
jgi:carnitine O-acetyltransferase